MWPNDAINQDEIGKNFKVPVYVFISINVTPSHFFTILSNPHEDANKETDFFTFKVITEIIFKCENSFLRLLTEERPPLFYALSYVMYTVEKKEKRLFLSYTCIIKSLFINSHPFPPPLLAIITDQTCSLITDPALWSVRISFLTFHLYIISPKWKPE